MPRRAQTIVLTVVLINLGLIAIVGYALDYGAEPMGVVFVTSAGPVAFGHRKHVLHGGEDHQCRSCHHDIKDAETHEKKCRGCHYYGREPHRSEKAKTHKRCVGHRCVSCHADKKCGYCHRQ